VRHAFPLVALFVILSFRAASAASPEDLEQTVCGWIKERVAFALWSFAAGKPDGDAWKAIPGAEPVQHRTVDGRVLRGYKIAARPRPDTTGLATGFVLLAQGNAMLADQLLVTAGELAEQGLDVYVYDYRGYGRSEGKPRLKAIVNDYREIFGALSAVNDVGRKSLYGISFGGLVVLNVIGGGAQFDRAIIDSTPSRVSQLGCPEQYDPVGNLPPDSARLLMISGARDGVVKPAEQAELLSVAKSRGARVVVSDSFDHPFMDRDPSVREQRQAIVSQFLSGRE
jgi:alpha/beta superfamily hydrolase